MVSRVKYSHCHSICKACIYHANPKVIGCMVLPKHCSQVLLHNHDHSKMHVYVYVCIKMYSFNNFYQHLYLENRGIVSLSGCVYVLANGDLGKYLGGHILLVYSWIEVLCILKIPVFEGLHNDI